MRMRLGVVLSKTGGALAKMWLPFQLGIGGVLGNGQQMMSWIALDEIPYVVDHLIKNDRIAGAVNVVSPQAVSNAQFTKILGQVIHRPTVYLSQVCDPFIIRGNGAEFVIGRRSCDSPSFAGERLSISFC